MNIVLDIWGGENHMEHVARFIRNFDDAIELAYQELRNGYLVNLRADPDFGPAENFDSRQLLS